MPGSDVLFPTSNYSTLIDQFLLFLFIKVNQESYLFGNQANQENNHGCNKQNYAHISETAVGKIGIQVIAKTDTKYRQTGREK